LFVRPPTYLSDALVGQHSPCRAIVRLLKANQPRSSQVNVFSSHLVAKLIDFQNAVLAHDRLDTDSADLGIASLFVIENVTISFTQEFITRAAMN
jgi:hypothetical protein